MSPKIGSTVNSNNLQTLSFFYICLQRLALDCNLQQADSNKHTPIPVQGMAGKDAQGRSLPQGQGIPEPHQYSQYICLVKEQLTCAKEVHDMLLTYSKKVSERQLGTQPAAAQQAPHPPQQVT